MKTTTLWKRVRPVMRTLPARDESKGRTARKKMAKIAMKICLMRQSRTNSMPSEDEIIE